MTSTSLFLVAECIQSVVGKHYKGKKLTSEEIRVQVNNPAQSKTLLKQSLFGNLKIKVTPHRTLNASQGVISEPDLCNETASDVLERLRDQGVVAVKRITTPRRKSGNQNQTRSRAFNRSALTEFVKATFLPCTTRESNQRAILLFPAWVTCTSSWNERSTSGPHDEQ